MIRIGVLPLQLDADFPRLFSHFRQPGETFAKLEPSPSPRLWEGVAVESQVFQLVIALNLSNTGETKWNNILRRCNHREVTLMAKSLRVHAKLDGNAVLAAGASRCIMNVMQAMIFSTIVFVVAEHMME